MSRLREFGESAASAVLERVGRGVGRVQEQKPLPYDLLESDEAYLVVFDTPGATRSDIQVRFLEGEVQIRVDRFRDFYESFEMRFPGRGLSLDGHAALPDDASVDPQAATATLADNGTLRVRIPKEAGAQTVEVTEEADDAVVDDPDEQSSTADTAQSSTDDADEDREG